MSEGDCIAAAEMDSLITNFCCDVLARKRVGAFVEYFWGGFHAGASRAVILIEGEERNET